MNTYSNTELKRRYGVKGILLAAACLCSLVLTFIGVSQPVKAEASEIFKSISVSVYSPGETDLLQAESSYAAHGRLRFYSSDRTVAAVTCNGRLLALNEGECTITAMDDSGVIDTCIVTVTPKPRIRVALTFDDGPGYYGNELMDTLAEYGVKVTFFMLGSNVASFKDNVKRAYEEGHEIGNHSWSHCVLSTCSAEKIQEEMETTNQAIFDACGAYPTVMRPPYGSYNQKVLDNVGLPAIFWSVDTLDWKYKDAEYVADQIINGAKDGAIILVHEIHKTTVEGVKLALERLQGSDVDFVTVTDLLTYGGQTISAGKIYSRR